MQCYLPWSWVIGTALGGAIAVCPTSAQIIPDATLPNNSVVTPSGNILNITGGTQAGTNLFHSFQQFSVLTGSTAFFNNALNIQNILTRVTGSVVSNIDGILKANGTANLFLINPNGIIFGQNARLDIGGSFLASTANRIKFTDGSEFNAVNPQFQTLLTISAPIGLQFGANPQEIQVQGVGARRDETNLNLLNSNEGLRVQPNKTLALVGGDVTLNRGIVTADGGRIELGSVARDSEVGLTENLSETLNYDRAFTLGKIQLLQEAVVDASGNNKTGSIRVQAGTVRLTGGAGIVANTLVNGLLENKAGIEINALESLEVIGYPSIISAQVVPKSTGMGSSVRILTGYLKVSGGARISTNTSGIGNAGNLTIQANDIEVTGTGIDESGKAFPSGIVARVPNLSASGKGGKLDITTGSLRVQNGAIVDASTNGSGDAGSLSITARNMIEVLDFLSRISTRVDANGAGKGGNLDITTESLRVSGGARISSNALNTGNAGDLTIQANDIEVTGTGTGTDESGEPFPSGIVALVPLNTSGKGGKLTITTGNLRVHNGAIVDASTKGSGNAGSLSITARNMIEVLDFLSRISTRVDANGAGNGGKLDITTESLRVSGGARISSNALNTGNAGDLTIQANDIEVTGTGTDESGEPFPSGIVALVPLNTSGKGGKLTITTGNLRVHNGAIVDASTKGSGNAGSLSITARNMIEVLNFPSRISAKVDEAATGNGGKIEIKTRSLRVAGGARISTNALNTGNAGDLTIQAKDIEVTGSGKDENVEFSGIVARVPTQETVGNGGSIKITTEQLQISDHARISADTVGKGNAGNLEFVANSIQIRRDGRVSVVSTDVGKIGNISIDALTLVLLEGSQIRTDDDDPSGGKISPQNTAVFKSRDSRISERGKEINAELAIQEPTLLYSPPIDASQLIVQSCLADQRGNEFIITGRGGIAPSPNEVLQGRRLLENFGRVSDQHSVVSDRLSSTTPYISHPTPLIETNGWAIAPNGKVTLIASAASATVHPVWSVFPKCTNAKGDRS